ncbi:hypothetical protein ROA7450_01244 [Roseovarius albus]|uniref:Uncharacterized protein n=2 Tax=Roseovarius albus TaxID=1247867 RepID=A0A1X6YS80_9RHOB|nr:hypothetical protein ROA7450_01244 [Roseovarius albus]
MEASGKVRLFTGVRLTIILCALALAIAYALGLDAASKIPGQFVKISLVVAIAAAHGRYGEFFMASTQLWKNLFWYIAMVISGAAVILLPAGPLIPIAAAVFSLILLVPLTYGGWVCFTNVKLALFARQLSRFSKTLSKSDKAEFQVRMKRNVNAL